MDWVFSIGIKIIVDLQGMNGTLNRHFCTEVEPIFLEHVKVCLCVSNFIFPDASDVDTDTKLLIISIAFFALLQECLWEHYQAIREYGHVDFLGVEIRSAKSSL